MLKAIFLREMLEGLVSRRLLFISLLCCTLIPLGVLVNQRSVEQFVAHQARAEAEYERSMQGFSPSDQVELKVFRRKSELASFATGLDQAVPSTVSLRKDGVSFGMGQMLDNPVAALFGRIDLLFIVKFVLSLVAIVLSFNMICGEKEAGTLRLVLSNPVPRDALLLGKYASALLLLVGPFAVGLLLSLLILQVQGTRALAGADQWLAIALLFIVSVLFLASFLSLGLFVSTLTSRSLTAITLLLFVWAGLIAVVPQVGGVVAEMVYPVESAESFLYKKSLATQDIERQRTAELRPFFNDPNYEEIRKPVALKYQAQLEGILSQMDQEYENRRRTQLRIASSLAALSPVSPMTFAFTTLSGTGVLQSDHFQARLAAYRQQINQEVFSQGYRDLLPGVGGALMISTVELQDLPKFRAERLPMSDVFRAVGWHIGLLFVFNAVFFFLAYWRFRRYDVR